MCAIRVVVGLGLVMLLLDTPDTPDTPDAFGAMRGHANEFARPQRSGRRRATGQAGAAEERYAASSFSWWMPKGLLAKKEPCHAIPGVA